jgi:NAD(P)H-dependent FMN reductase
MNFCVLYGSVRETRKGIRLAKYLIKQLELRGHHVDFLDAMELNLPMLNKRFSDYAPGDAPEQLERLSEILKMSDGFVIVTGEYNHTIQPALKNMLDHFGPHEYGHKPSAIATYSGGDFGGVRAASAMLSTTWTLKMPAIPAQFVTPRVEEHYDEYGNPTDPSIDHRAATFIGALEWYAAALKGAREIGIPK